MHLVFLFWYMTYNTLTGLKHRLVHEINANFMSRSCQGRGGRPALLTYYADYHDRGVRDQYRDVVVRVQLSGMLLNIKHLNYDRRLNRCWKGHQRETKFSCLRRTRFSYLRRTRFNCLWRARFSCLRRTRFSCLRRICFSCLRRTRFHFFSVLSFLSSE